LLVQAIQVLTATFLVPTHFLSIIHPLAAVDCLVQSRSITHSLSQIIATLTVKAGAKAKPWEKLKQLICFSVICHSSTAHQCSYPLLSPKLEVRSVYFFNFAVFVFSIKFSAVLD
jgi:hypothetical protein